MNEFYKDLLSQNRNIEKIEEMTIKNTSETLKLTFRRVKIYMVDLLLHNKPRSRAVERRGH